jgi:hypothetical protein
MCWSTSISSRYRIWAEGSGAHHRAAGAGQRPVTPGHAGVDLQEAQGAGVALPCGAVVCLVATFKAWIRAAGITAAPMFSPAAKGEVT